MKSIKAGGKDYDLVWVKGRVEETGKNLETKISGGGGGGATFGGYGGTAPVSIRSQTIIHDQIFLVDSAGNEHSFQLQGFNVACRAGNELTVLWAVKKGDKSGAYITVYNQSTGNVFSNKAALNKVFRRPVLHMLVAVIACFILGKAVGIFYYGVVLVPIAWFAEGYFGAKKFLEETNFKEFN